ncbi:MAG: response regulator transcription factor [Solirubrobacterales bacterium]
MRPPSYSGSKQRGCSSLARATRCSWPRGWASRERPRQATAQSGQFTRRELEVLQLAARGLTTRQIADRLYISPKTADHHIQHIYGKIDVSTRAAAALWAMQHTVVQ